MTAELHAFANKSVVEAIVAALEDPRYQWRTVEGISNDTGLDHGTVAAALRNLPNQLVCSSTPDTEGRLLYTTRQHYKQTQSLASRLLNVLADRIA